MTTWAFWFLAGLLTGWNFLPQPGWVKTSVAWIVAKVKSQLTPKA